MANISDFILKQVTAQTGKVNVPGNLKDQVLGGLSDSILGGLKQTAAQPTGLDQIKDLLTGKAGAAQSPVTSIATNIFVNNTLSKLGLDQKLGSSLTAVIPKVVGKLSGFIKDQDGDGDVDINDIILSLKGNGGGGLLGAATSILGGILKK